jgi:hypothetical protein
LAHAGNGDASHANVLAWDPTRRVDPARAPRDAPRNPTLRKEISAEGATTYSCGGRTLYLITQRLDEDQWMMLEHEMRRALCGRERAAQHELQAARQEAAAKQFDEVVLRDYEGRFGPDRGVRL